MRLSKLSDTIMSFKGALFNIMLPFASISILFLNGIDASASSTVNDFPEPDQSLHVRKSPLPEQGHRAYPKNLLLQSAVSREMNEDRSNNETDKLLTRQLEKEVEDFYLPRLVMLFNDMSSVLGIPASVQSQKEESKQMEESIVDNIDSTVQEEALNERKIPVRAYLKKGKEYYVQVGTWKNPDNAQKMLAKVRKYYPAVYMVVHNNFNKVRIPGVMTRKYAHFISRDLEEKFNLKALPVQKIQ